MPYTRLTKEIKKRVEKLPYVDAFYIHGSRGAGTHSPTSDIDYMFLLKDEKRDLKKLRKALGDLLEFKKMRGWYPEQIWEVCSWKQKNLDIGFHSWTTKDIIAIFSKLFKNKKYFLKHQDWAQFFIVEAKPVYDPKGYVRKLKKMVSRYPSWLSKQIVKEMVRNLKTKLMWVSDDWKPRNKYAFINDVRDIVWFIAAAHYAKNKAFLMNSMKRWRQDMKTFKPNIKKELDMLLRIDKNFFKDNKAVYLKKIIRKLEK